jgi:hypothetical protein
MHLTRLKITDRETSVAGDAEKRWMANTIKWIAGYLAVRCIAWLDLI